MAWLKWSEELSCNHPTLDDEHRELMGMIRELGEVIANGQFMRAEVLLATLSEAAQHHFGTEEAIMDAQIAVDTSIVARHKEAHRNVTRQLRAFAAEGPESYAQLHAYLQKWLFTHLLELDKRTFCT